MPLNFHKKFRFAKFKAVFMSRRIEKTALREISKIGTGFVFTQNQWNYRVYDQGEHQQ
jgi:hypothetical protein